MKAILVELLKSMPHFMLNSKFKKWFIISFMLELSAISYGQTLVDLNSPLFQEARIEELNDTTYSSFFYRMNWIHTERTATHVAKKFEILPINFRSHYNSKYPRDFNNGAVWTGKGLSMALSGGVSYKTRNVEVTIFPTLWYAQNDPFVLEPLTYSDSNVFRYPYSPHIDLPQRFGKEPLTELNPGQSRIKYVWKKKLYTQLSTENMWWGPSYVNSITMTNTASGFPHLAIGSQKLLPTKIGAFGFHLFWGYLEESDFFDNGDVNGKLLNAVNIEYYPPFLEGLQFGVSRFAYTSWENLSTSDFFKGFSSFRSILDPNLGPGVNDTFDQVLSVFFRWRFPSVGFEAYYEYARNDFGGDIRNLLVTNPDHSRFYTFGFAKNITINTQKTLRLLVEFNKFSRSDTRLLGPSPPLYIHPLANGGYTHQGQLVGAPIGPESNSQYISAMLRTKNATYEVILNRIGYNDGFYFDNAINLDLKRDVEATGGLKATWFYGHHFLGFDLMISDRENWYFKRQVTNISLEFNYTKLFK